MRQTTASKLKANLKVTYILKERTVSQFCSSQLCNILLHQPKGTLCVFWRYGSFFRYGNILEVKLERAIVILEPRGFRWKTSDTSMDTRISLISECQDVLHLCIHPFLKQHVCLSNVPFLWVIVYLLHEFGHVVALSPDFIGTILECFLPA